MDKSYLKLIGWILGIIGVGALFLSVVAPPLGGTHPPPLQVIDWERPTTDAGWAEDAKAESFELKFDYQLLEMKVSHERKLPLQEEDLREIVECPDCIRWQLKQNFEQMFEDGEVDLFGKLEGKTLQEWIDGEFIEQLK